MQKLFWLVNKKTGEKFRPSRKKFVVLLPSGKALFIEQDFYTYTSLVDNEEWEIRFYEDGIL